MRNFIHSGDLGDIIYSLPAVKATGGGTIWLAPQTGVQTMHPMNGPRFNAIAPLLKAQSYIQDVRPSLPRDAAAINLNRFRGMNFDLCNTNLADIYLSVEGKSTAHRSKPWLTAPKTRYESIVISRSARYHNLGFPWRKLLSHYAGNTIFLGTPAEHQAFAEEFGSIPYAETKTLFDVARIINAADLFIGNQSCPLAIAHGLGVPVLIEVCLYCPNCIFRRPGEFLGFGDFEIPHALPKPREADVSHVAEACPV